ncbi:hypothetical protein RQP46_010001 [Phenoliferia psychrophenolica]
MPSKPVLQYTPLAQIAPQDNQKAITDAVLADLGRPAFETIVAELEPTKGEINEAISHLNGWAKPRKVKTSFAWYFAKATVASVPKGCALIIGTWNYPIALLFGPVIGAIAAGCAAILKPAEQNTTLAALWAALVPKYLDQSAYILINGAVEETTALLKLRFDHIFYTGSGTVGRIVAKAAAEHLTPVTLELGGKSPACICDDADVTIAGRRIMWGKYNNSGQICISPDYVCCTREMQPKLIESFKAAIAEFSPSGTLTENAEFSSLINPAHFARISKLIDGTEGRVVIGGGRDEASNKIEITVVADVKESDVLMQGEIFGPVLPILTFESKRAMVDFINARDNPLALYVFTKSTADRDYFFKNTRSGSFVQNDVLVQFLIPGLPFGGAGPSGYGGYHGKHSFDTFSHERSSAAIPNWLEMVLAARYPPYNQSKLKQMLLLTGQKISR